MNTKTLILFCLLLSLAATAQCLAEGAASASKTVSQKCVDYGPATVTLRGQLLRATFRTFMSKQKETVWVLKLDKPICMNAGAENEFDIKQAHVKEIQLGLDKEMYRKYRALLNKRVEASGMLFGAHTQHHVTDVLLDAKEIKAIKKGI